MSWDDRTPEQKAHRHSFELDPKDRGFQNYAALWFRCRDLKHCLSPYMLVPRQLYYRMLRGGPGAMAEWINWLRRNHY